jgi:hypothetical protein
VISPGVLASWDTETPCEKINLEGADSVQGLAVTDDRKAPNHWSVSKSKFQNGGREISGVQKAHEGACYVEAKERDDHAQRTNVVSEMPGMFHN